MREFHAHCVCVVGKNYRLQDIQLSKINPGEISPRGISFGDPRGAFPRTPFARSLAGPQSPAPFRSRCRWLINQPPTKIFQRPFAVSLTHDLKILRVSLLSRAGAAMGAGEAARLNVAPSILENTGLEPVTSWLQTRRSPS